MESLIEVHKIVVDAPSSWGATLLDKFPSLSAQPRGFRGISKTQLFKTILFKHPLSFVSAVAINPSESTPELIQSPSFFELPTDRDNIGTSTNIIEHKQPKQGLQHQTAREQLLGVTAQRIRQSLDLETILNQTVTELRQFLVCDRVILNRFEPDGSGVAELF